MSEKHSNGLGKMGFAVGLEAGFKEIPDSLNEFAIHCRLGAVGF
jgi:hypothetical protein